MFREIPASPRIGASVQALWVKAGYRPPQPHAPCDAMVLEPCYSFLEIWPVAARHLVKTGLAAQASLRSGMTVRELFRELYGLKAGPERDPAMERRVFLRTLRRAKLAESN